MDVLPKDLLLLKLMSSSSYLQTHQPTKLYQQELKELNEDVWEVLVQICYKYTTNNYISETNTHGSQLHRGCGEERGLGWAVGFLGSLYWPPLSRTSVLVMPSLGACMEVWGSENYVLPG